MPIKNNAVQYLYVKNPTNMNNFKVLQVDLSVNHTGPVVVNFDFEPYLHHIVSMSRTLKCSTGHVWLTSLYPRHLCRRVYSFRFSVCPFVYSLVRSLVR